ncbi:hypothetical protein [Lysobacter panacisoli]|uniref:Uncharacterized protein n=1 Tax=Lysobacter panacisoli TaxID=1255263 RepID=A0ABP9LLF4_9GAMM|nr:hypothetical protein [Lysobacter panacisoli]
MRVHVSVADGDAGEWLNVVAVAGVEQASFGIALIRYDAEFALHNGEAMRVAGTFDPLHHGVNIDLFSGERHVANLGGFKSPTDGYDPSLIVLTPGGNYLQVMVGA